MGHLEMSGIGGGDGDEVWKELENVQVMYRDMEAKVGHVGKVNRYLDSELDKLRRSFSKLEKERDRCLEYFTTFFICLSLYLEIYVVPMLH